MTIYRTLESLVDAGLVHRAFMQEGPGTSNWPITVPTDNATRTSPARTAGRTHCLNDFSMPMAPRFYKGFVIQHQQVRLEGLCPACA